MRVVFSSYAYGEQSLDIGKLNYVVGCNGSGKTSFLKYLRDGFEGSLKKMFIFNGNIINKKDYEVFFIKDVDTLEIEEGLSSKSQIKNRVDFTYDVVEESLKKAIEDKVISLSSIIENEVLKNVELTENLKLSFDLCLKDILMKNISIKINEKNIKESSFTSRRIELYNLFIDTIKSHNKPSILIIDEIFLGFSKYERDNILEKFKDLSSLFPCIVFLSSSTKLFSDNINNIYISDNKFKNELISLDEIKDIISSKKNISKEDIGKYYTLDDIEKFIAKNDILDKYFEKLLSNKTYKTP